jgi:phosphomannomutase
LTPQIDVDAILVAMTEIQNEDITYIDGWKLTLPMNGFIWKSNTEPIIRISLWSTVQAQADTLALRIIDRNESGGRLLKASTFKL